MNTAEFLAFVDALAKRGPVESASAHGFSVTFRSPFDAELADAADKLIPMIERELARKPVT